MIKLIAIDLDGTLFSGKFKQTISEENKEAIRKAREKGCKVVIATGRPIVGVLPVLEQLGINTIDDYVIVYNGAIVYNVGSKKVVNSITITGKDVKELYYESKRLNANFHAFRENEELITDEHNAYTDVECQLNKIEDLIVDFSEISDEEQFLKAMIVSDKITLDFAMNNINPKFKENYTMIRSADIFLEFLNRKTDKGYAMLALANYLNIETAEIMSIGDAGNDLMMIKLAGVGVAMENAYEYVKAAADYITLSNDEHGVAHAIHKFVLRD